MKYDKICGTCGNPRSHGSGRRCRRCYLADAREVKLVRLETDYLMAIPRLIRQARLARDKQIALLEPKTRRVIRKAERLYREMAKLQPLNQPLWEE